MPSDAGVVDLIPGWGANIPHASWWKAENIRQKESRWHGNIYITTCEIVSPGNVLYDAGNSNWDCVTTKTGVMGREVGGRFKKEETEVHLWLLHVDVWQKPAQYCNAIILQFKINRQLKNPEGILLPVQERIKKCFSTLTSVFYS